MFFSICVVVIVLLSVYFMLSCSNTNEIKNVGEKIDDVSLKVSLLNELASVIYPLDKKDKDAVVVDQPTNIGVTTGLVGTVTIDTISTVEEQEPEQQEPKKRKPRKKTRCCENCANFVPIKEPKKRTTKKKEVLNEQKTKEETN